MIHQQLIYHFIKHLQLKKPKIFVQQNNKDDFLKSNLSSPKRLIIVDQFIPLKP